MLPSPFRDTTDLIPAVVTITCYETLQYMFITPLYYQHASHTLASRAYGPQSHMRSYSATGPYMYTDLGYEFALTCHDALDLAGQLSNAVNGIVSGFTGAEKAIDMFRTCNGAAPTR